MIAQILPRVVDFTLFFCKSNAHETTHTFILESCETSIVSNCSSSRSNCCYTERWWMWNLINLHISVYYRDLTSLHRDNVYTCNGRKIYITSLIWSITHEFQKFENKYIGTYNSFHFISNSLNPSTHNNILYSSYY